MFKYITNLLGSVVFGKFVFVIIQQMRLHFVVKTTLYCETVPIYNFSSSLHVSFRYIFYVTLGFSDQIIQASDVNLCTKLRNYRITTII